MPTPRLTPRNSIYVFVAMCSIAVAACQPSDHSAERVGRDIDNAAKNLSVEVDKAAAKTDVALAKAADKTQAAAQRASEKTQQVIADIKK